MDRSPLRLSAQPDLNRRLPLSCDTSWCRLLVWMSGFDPLTSCVRGRRATRLRYTQVNWRVAGVLISARP